MKSLFWTWWLSCVLQFLFFPITSNQGNYESHFYRAVIFFFRFSSGLKTYLISGRKSEHDVQCGCSQVGHSGGDFVGVGLSPYPQPRTPDLISRGAQAALPVLPHQPPDRLGVSNEDGNCCIISYFLWGWKHSYATLCRDIVISRAASVWYVFIFQPLPPLPFSLCLASLCVSQWGLVFGDRARWWRGCAERLSGGAQDQHCQGTTYTLTHAWTVATAIYMSNSPLSICHYTSSRPCAPPTLPTFSLLLCFFSIWILSSSLSPSLSPPHPVHPRSQPQGRQWSPESSAGGPGASQPELPVRHAPGER